MGDAVTPRTRLIMVNSPQSQWRGVLRRGPGGAGRDHAAAGHPGAVRRVYEHIVFDGSPHQACCAMPSWPSAASWSAPSADHHCTGWKVGYCVAPRALSAEFQRCTGTLTFAPSPRRSGRLPTCWSRSAALSGSAGLLPGQARPFFAVASPARASNCCRSAAPTSSWPTTPRSVTRTTSTSANGWFAEAGVAAIPFRPSARPRPRRAWCVFCFAKERRHAARRPGALVRLWGRRDEPALHSRFARESDPGQYALARRQWPTVRTTAPWCAACVNRGDLVVLPETFTSGFTNETLGNAQTMQGEPRLAAARAGRRGRRGADRQPWSCARAMPASIAWCGCVRTAASMSRQSATCSA